MGPVTWISFRTKQREKNTHTIAVVVRSDERRPVLRHASCEVRGQLDSRVHDIDVRACARGSWVVLSVERKVALIDAIESPIPGSGAGFDLKRDLFVRVLRCRHLVAHGRTVGNERVPVRVLSVEEPQRLWVARKVHGFQEDQTGCFDLRSKRFWLRRSLSCGVVDEHHPSVILLRRTEHQRRREKKQKKPHN